MVFCGTEIGLMVPKLRSPIASHSVAVPHSETFELVDAPGPKAWYSQLEYEKSSPYVVPIFLRDTLFLYQRKEHSHRNLVRESIFCGIWTVNNHIIWKLDAEEFQVF